MRCHRPKLKHWILPPKWLRFLIVILLVLGIFFRFVNLDRKGYWNDEVFTSLRISGYTEAELVQQVFDGHEIGIEDLQKYQRRNPEKDVTYTIKGLAIEEPQNAPLYFVLARFWVEAFGNSVAVTRSLSAFISLFAFPCVYWLCLELFKSPLTGWIAVALIAVSPFHVQYAQEARGYSLWTVTILLSSAALLRAMRLKTKLSWGIYAATMALGLYTYMFSVFVAIGHGIYVVVTEKFRLSKTVITYFVASLVGLLAFAPWMVIVIINFQQVQATTDWVAKGKLTPLGFVTGSVHNLRIAFYDLDIGPYLTPVFLILLGYSFYFLCRNTPKQVWLFILTLIGIMALPLILQDLISGGTRSLIARYIIPCYLGIQLAVAHLLATQIVADSFLQRKIWRAIMVVLISGGVVSGAISSQAEDSLSKFSTYENRQVAHIINQAVRPLLITDNSGLNVGNVVSLSYLLEPKVRLLLVVEPNIPKIPSGFNDMFLYKPSKALRAGLETEQNYKLKPVDKISNNWLGKLEKQ